MTRLQLSSGVRRTPVTMVMRSLLPCLLLALGVGACDREPSRRDAGDPGALDSARAVRLATAVFDSITGGRYQIEIYAIVRDSAGYLITGVSVQPGGDTAILDGGATVRVAPDGRTSVVAGRH